MRLFLLFLLSLSGCAGTSKLEPWEHGWKTPNVIGTRMHSDTMGWNAKFEFPKDPYNCDAVELDEFIKTQGGYAFEMGGYPGAPIYAIFKGANSKDALGGKIKDVLPGLDKIIVKLRH